MQNMQLNAVSCDNCQLHCSSICKPAFLHSQQAYVWQNSTIWTWIINVYYYIPELIPLYFTIRGNRAINLWTAQYELHDCRPPKGPPYMMTPTNDGRVRQRLLIRCYIAMGMVTQIIRPFSAGINCQNTVFLGVIGPNTTPKIIQNISKTWDEVYNNRVIALVQGLGEEALASSGRHQWFGHTTINPWTRAITLNTCV